MYEDSGSMRPSQSMENLTSGPPRQRNDARKRSGSTAFLDVPAARDLGAGPKRFSTPDIAHLAAKIQQVELSKLQRFGGSSGGKDRNGSSRTSDVFGSRDSLTSAGTDASRYQGSRPVSKHSSSEVSPPADYENPFFGKRSAFSRADGDASNAGYSSDESGLEINRQKSQENPRRSRTNSLQVNPTADSDIGYYATPVDALRRGSEATGARGSTPSLQELQSAKLHLRSANQQRLSPSPNLQRRSPSPSRAAPATRPGEDQRRSTGDMTRVMSSALPPPPLPPPRPSRMLNKRYSVPDLLDDGGDQNELLGVWRPPGDLSRRRNTVADITENRPLPSPDNLGADGSVASRRPSTISLTPSAPPPPPPPPPPGSQSSRSPSKSPSLRRKAMETRSLANSVSNNSSKASLHNSQSLPLINVTGNSPESDYPEDETPFTFDTASRSSSPQPTSAAKDGSGDSKSNIYKAVSETSTLTSYIDDYAKGGSRTDDTGSSHGSKGSEDTRSIHTDSGLDDECKDDPGIWRPYDAFQLSERDNEDDGDVFREILKVLRLILYFFITSTVLVGTVASRLSLFLLTSGVTQNEKLEGECVVMLIFCVCCPIAVSWFSSFVKILFSEKEWPSILTFLYLLTVEMLQTFGVCLLLFRVLPVTDFFRGITLTMAAFQFPALLKLVVTEHKLSFGPWNCIKMITAFLAFGAQVTAIVFFLVTRFPEEGVHSTIPKNDTMPEGNQLPGAPNLSDLNWELPLALTLMSLGWWENYVSGEWSLCGKVTLSFKRARKVVQDVRDTSTVLVGPFKVGLTVILAKFLTGATFRLPEQTEEDTRDASQFHLDSYSLLYLQLLASILVTYLASLACKLHMQKTAFALPLLLSPPASLAVVYLQCRYEFLPGDWHTGVWLCPSVAVDDLLLPLSCAGALWVSYCLVVSHVWFPKSERMAKTQKLFITPHFDAIFPDFHLTLRRRRNDHELRAARLETFKYVGEDNPYSSEDDNATSDITPMVYVCATMWHETRREMTQLLKSLFRLDYVHCASRLAQDEFQIKDPDYYDLEIHIMFDDSFELDDEADKFVPNIFVRQLIESMEEAARSVLKGPIDIPPPVKTPTPYGGLLVWTMPGLTKMHVHLKNKNLIRHRKRWSQCMYLYYLLGYRLLGGKDDTASDSASNGEPDQTDTNLRHRGDKDKSKTNKTNAKAKRRKAMPLRSLLGHMSPEKYEKTVQMSENTFILTLDGDVDFKPDSVRLLLDRMKKNKKVGAVCGRIHPIGSGPMVWYQQFEYAVGHWLQKASEHVFGCVLCCPGCFSLFRGSALMDDNVVRRYTTKPTEAAHFIQFEQGEDRWLCTLLLQQGHRIDYSAGADALTFAPETFNEFFNQRRRWSPSTLANMMDLLSTWRETVRINDNVSRFYILYQFLLMASSILAPSTVVLMITGSFHSVLGMSIWWAFLLSLAPVIFYLMICLTQKNDVQIKVGAVLTAMYTVIMMIATVGTLISIATESFSSPNVVFLTGLFVIFFIASLLHPQEFFCLVYGALYFLVVPSTFILLTVFYLCNLNNVSWGTREMPKKVTPEEAEAQRKAEEEKAKRKGKNMFSLYGIVSVLHELRDAVRGLWGLRNELQTQQQQQPQKTNDGSNQQQNGEKMDDPELGLRPPIQPAPASKRTQPVGHEPRPESPHWLGLDYLGYGTVETISEEEKEFWKFLIHKYLYPIEEDKAHKVKIAEDLAIVRNNVVFIYVMMNFLWCVIALQLQAMEDTLKTFYVVEKYEPLSLVFLSIFALVLLLQFVSMLMHRWGTFLHLMSTTRVDWCKKYHSEEEFARYVVSQTKLLQNLEPLPDYEAGDDGDDGFDSEEDGMSLSDFDASLSQPGTYGRRRDGGNLGGRGGRSEVFAAASASAGGAFGDDKEASGIYETLGRHSQHRHQHHSNNSSHHQNHSSGHQQHHQARYYPPHPAILHRATSTHGQFPMLKTIFEQNLTNLQQRYQQRGPVSRTSGRGPVLLGGTQRRYWGDRNGEMRQRFFNQNFQMPTHSRGGRIFRADAGELV